MKIVIVLMKIISMDRNFHATEWIREVDRFLK